MRQAIEEGFILDVLQNYTPYSLAFRLANDGKEHTEQEVERSAGHERPDAVGEATPLQYQPEGPAGRGALPLDGAALLEGKAKAMMVVVGSRVEAVRWQLAIEKYIRSQGVQHRDARGLLRYVKDPKSSPYDLTEDSLQLNYHLNGRDIREAFKLA